MMTEPLWGRLSAGPRFAQGLADLRFEKRTRFLFVGETMIRHASPSRTVTATSGSVHGANTWRLLIAAPTTKKRPTRHFIVTVRHITPQPSADSGRLQSRSAQACRRARASQCQ